MVELQQVILQITTDKQRSLRISTSDIMLSFDGFAKRGDRLACSHQAKLHGVRIAFHFVIHKYLTVVICSHRLVTVISVKQKISFCGLLHEI